MEMGTQMLIEDMIEKIVLKSSNLQTFQQRATTLNNRKKGLWRVFSEKKKLRTISALNNEATVVKFPTIAIKMLNFLLFNTQNWTVGELS